MKNVPAFLLESDVKNIIELQEPVQIIKTFSIVGLKVKLTTCISVASQPKKAIKNFLAKENILSTFKKCKIKKFFVLDITVDNNPLNEILKDL